jgi:plasmid stabilization system protein ParE
MTKEWAEPTAPLAFRYADLSCATGVAPAIPAITHTYRARRDLLHVWRHIRDRNPAAADRFFQRIQARIEILRQFPKAGARRPELARDARVLVEPPYLILYPNFHSFR